MAITINDETVFDDSRNANVAQIVLNTYGTFLVASNVAPATTPPYAGTVSGYASGGVNPAVPAFRNNIQKFPFASDGNSTIVASLIRSRRRGHSSSSETHGYVIGGDSGTAGSGSIPISAGNGYELSIERFPFATDSNAVLSGALNYFRIASGGGSASPTHAYSSGGRGAFSWIIDTERFPFAADAISAQVGGVQYAVISAAEFSSLTAGYILSGSLISGGSALPTPAASQTIMISAVQKYEFAYESDAVQIGDLSLARLLFVGVSSQTHGYGAGGVSPTPVIRYRTVDKMSFASEGTSSYVGDLTANNASNAQCSSGNNGYVLGGATSNNPPAPVTSTNAIDKFPFASDANATDVGDLNEGLVQAFGNQN